MADELLNDVLRLQQEVRVLEQQLASDVRAQPQTASYHYGVLANTKPRTVQGVSYYPTTPASLPSGQPIISSPTDTPGEVNWADSVRNAPPSDLERSKCPDTANCLDEDFCYSDYDCGECDNCRDYKCSEIDFYEPCQTGDKPPCTGVVDDNGKPLPVVCMDPPWRWWDDWDFNPRTGTFYPNPAGLGNIYGDYTDAPGGSSSVGAGGFANNINPQSGGSLKNWFQSCRNSDDCIFGEVCDNRYFYCTPSCLTDQQCNPASPQRAGDAKFGSFCVDGECITPCEPPVLCLYDNECPEGEICVDRPGRAAGESGPRSTKYCQPGCRTNAQCTGNDRCVDGICQERCTSSNQCGPGSGCVGGQCTQIGSICSGTCPPGQSCNSDGRCVQDEICIGPGCGQTCITQSDCAFGYACVSGSCQKARNNFEEIEVCRDEEVCGQRFDEDGNLIGDFDCAVIERCRTQRVYQPIASSIFECECFETCNQSGQCAQLVCSSDADCSCGLCVNGACVPEECNTDTDCDVKEACIGGKCTPICETDADCEEPEVCLSDGFCGPACEPIIQCSANDQCPDDFYCDGTICQYGCRVDADCTGGGSCLDGSCVFTCLSNADCDNTEVCTNGVCEAAPTPPCVNDNSCGSGSYCKAGECLTGCRVDDSCPGQQICVNNECRQRCVNAEECVALEVGNACQRGFCLTVSTPDSVSKEGRQGCGCGEVCDEYGVCNKVKCNNNRQCQKGDQAGSCEGEGTCLASGECGDCQSDADCPKKTICVDNVCITECIPATRCQGPADCPPGFFCAEKTGVCENGCASDTDCIPGQICRDNQCTSTCATSNDCLRGEICNAGACVWRGIPCSIQDDCPAGEYCVSGLCQEDQRCSTNYDCDVNFSCVNGSCVPGSGCRTGKDCASTYCYLGRCVDYRPCRTQADCDDETFQCIDGSCKVAQACRSDIQCEPNEYCYRGACVYDNRCYANSNNCPAGQECCEGKCIDPEPNSNKRPSVGCPENYYCDETSFRCEPLPCDENDDCDFGTCNLELGICEDVPECETDIDCPGLQECVNGECFLPCETDADCPSDVSCIAGYCESECSVDSDCATGQKCSRGECKTVCTTDADCPSSTQVCLNGLCEDDDEQNCDFDADCKRGICLEGRCRECRNSSNCLSIYGKSGMVCNDGECMTPCTTSLSDGSCEQGLELGDLCDNCPDRCPEGSTCEPGGELCGTVASFDADLGRTVYSAIPCYTCTKPCSEGSDCPPDHKCVDRGCIPAGGKCDSDDDCDLGDGVSRYCSSFECIEAAESCFAQSDCPAGYICTRGQCQKGDAGDDILCPRGQVARNGQCYFMCDTAYLSCAVSTGEIGSLSVPCPPGYRCTNNRCIRTGYSGVDDLMGCPHGYFCCEGACIPYSSGSKECCSDSQCPAGQSCVNLDSEDLGGSVCREVPSGTTACPNSGSSRYNERKARQSKYSSAEADYSAALKRYTDLTRNPYSTPDYSTLLAAAEDALAQADVARDQAYEAYVRGDSGWMGFASQNCARERREVARDPISPSDPVEQLDTCQLDGLCCGQDGFCEECACSVENPCPAGQCCDPEAGLCVQKSVHPNTKYGAPGLCSFDAVFCELLDKEGSAFDPNTIFDGVGFEWCELVSDEVGVVVEKPHPTIPNVTVKSIEYSDEPTRKCYEGGDPSPDQIAELLNQYCEKDPEENECECIAEPAYECANDFDCGICQECRITYLKQDACCNSYVVQTVKNDQGEDVEVELPGFLSATCETIIDKDLQPDKWSLECQCESDDDCTECEECKLVPEAGNKRHCVPDCEKLCPTGGDTTNRWKDGKGNSDPIKGGCPSCEDQYGICAEERTLAFSEDRYDVDGNFRQGESVKACFWKTGDCCEAFRTGRIPASEAKNYRDGCLRKIETDKNGTEVLKQVEYCFDFDDQECAECTQDSHCPGNSKCRYYKCITECGFTDSVGLGGTGNVRTPDVFPVGECTCCTEGGECKQLYESWQETRTNASTKEEECRPCECTENGINCLAYDNCQACYKWERLDDTGEINEIVQKANFLGIENELQYWTARLEGLEANLPWIQEDYDTALAWKIKKEQVITEAGCPFESNENTTGMCDDYINDYNNAVANLELPRSTLEIQLTAIQEAENTIRYLNARMDEAYRPSAWRKVRQCDCCIDGMCRDDSDCSLGTCYVCVDNSDPDALREMKFYRAAIYNKVKALRDGVWQLTCMGEVPYYEFGNDKTPNNAADTAVGSNVVYYDFDVDQCVKYRCQDGIFLRELGGYINSIHYYEYCTGSIITCALKGRDIEAVESEYSQGWNFEVDLKNAGIWIVNAVSDNEIGGAGWCRMSYPSQTSWEASCRYPNPLAHIRGNTLPTYIDLEYTHECCSHSGLWMECDPDHPNCHMRFMSYYAAGANSNLKRKLERDVEALKQYLLSLYETLLELIKIKQQKLADKQTYVPKAERRMNEYNDLRAQWEEVQYEIQQSNLENSDSGIFITYEEEIKRLDEEIDELETYKSGLESERDSKISERSDVQSNIDAKEVEYSVAASNQQNAAAAAKASNDQAQQIQFEITNLEQQMALLDPASVEYFDLSQQVNLLVVDRDAALDEAQTQSSAATGYADELIALSADIEALQDQLPPIQDRLNQLNELITSAASEISRANTEKRVWQGKLAELKREQFELNKEKTDIENRMDFLSAWVSVVTPPGANAEDRTYAIWPQYQGNIEGEIAHGTDYDQLQWYDDIVQQVQDMIDVLYQSCDGPDPDATDLLLSNTTNVNADNDSKYTDSEGNEKTCNPGEIQEIHEEIRKKEEQIENIEADLAVPEELECTYRPDALSDDIWTADEIRENWAQNLEAAEKAQTEWWSADE